MITRSTSCRRRSFAFISETVMPAVSSMNICAPLKTWAVCTSFTQSASSSEPERRRLLSTKASQERILEVICSLLISRENIATLRFLRATFTAILRAKLVLPMPGRAAISIRSDLLSPPIFLSTALYPVFIPRNFSLSGPASLFMRS